jgi:1,4-dihydroxy-2-naphthoate octaprenyltransferase
MKKRHIISLTLFVVAVLLLLVVGLGTAKWLVAVLLGLVFVLAGLVFYRRGK